MININIYCSESPGFKVRRWTFLVILPAYTAVEVGTKRLAGAKFGEKLNYHFKHKTQIHDSEAPLVPYRCHLYPQKTIEIHLAPSKELAIGNLAKPRVPPLIRRP